MLEELRSTLRALPERPPHLLVVHWKALAPAFHAHVGSKLAPGTVLYLPGEYGSDKSLWITPADPHWNAVGHARVARLLYGTIRAHGLLTGVTLGKWAEADGAAADEPARGLAYVVENQGRLSEAVRGQVSEIELSEVTPEEARQIYGGIDREGLVSPYASLTLWRPPGARELYLAGTALPDRALAGARVRVYLEEIELAVLELQPDAALALRQPIPRELDGRAWLNLRFTSDDHVYRGSDQRRCVVFQLRRAVLE